jgi:uncharacterized membrane protein SpoIIM required for sporulation
MIKRNIFLSIIIYLIFIFKFFKVNYYYFFVKQRISPINHGLQTGSCCTSF